MEFESHGMLKIYLTGLLEEKKWLDGPTATG
jgi:hypothetical protein